MSIVAYISGHGFGHASRSIELLNTLADLRPDLQLIVRSMVAPWLIASTARPGIALERVECDTGIVQIDSLRLDETETLARAARFMASLPERAQIEAAALTEHGADLVIADIPALGVAAGHAARIPAIALGNFSWDWAYRAYDGGGAIADAVAEAYRSAALALRLPLWGGFEAFPRVEDIPLIARRSHRDPAETREAFGLPPADRLVLASFGGFGLEGLDLDRLARLDGWRVLVSDQTRFGPAGRLLKERGPTGSLLPLDESAIYARGFRYEDLVRAVDAVVTKPGYGIIAECAANDTAMLYTSRGNFVEYNVLVAGMGRYVRSAFIDQGALFAGHWEPHLDRLIGKPRPAEPTRTDGAEVAARRILEVLGGGR